MTSTRSTKTEAIPKEWLNYGYDFGGNRINTIVDTQFRFSDLSNALSDESLELLKGFAIAIAPGQIKILSSVFLAIRLILKIRKEYRNGAGKSGESSV